MLLLEIEKELHGPDGQTALQRYDRILADLDVRLASAMADGLAPYDYSNAEQLKKAVLLSRKLLRIAALGGNVGK